MNIEKLVDAKREEQDQAVAKFKLGLKELVDDAGEHLQRARHALSIGRPIAEKAAYALDRLWDLEGSLTFMQRSHLDAAHELMRHGNALTTVEQGLRMYATVQFGDVKDFNSRNKTESMIVERLNGASGITSRVKQLTSQLKRFMDDELTQESN